MTLTALLGILLFASVLYAVPIVNENGATSYLQKFGYLEETDPGAFIEYERVSSAIREFQKFAGLTQTGDLNSETIAMMNVPRCGVKDKLEPSGSGRKKRFALEGSKWPVKELTYRITKYPARITDPLKVRHEVARAFKMWSDVSEISFREAMAGTVDIDIRFDARDHGDGVAFDGPGKTLAHAFFPRYGGAAHFDDEEAWTINEKMGTNLIQVAAHEFGHSLGLIHTDVQQAIMAPYYKGYNPGFKSHDDDIRGIQNLYGPPPDNPADMCRDASLDTITRTQDGSTYAFKGKFYWKINYNVTAEGYPRRITEDWGGLEENLDASFTLKDGKTYFFKGGRYWSFTNKRMDSGFPKLITVGFKGIPDNLDAAVTWGENGKPYFFKGNEYWRYDFGENPPVNQMYPLSIREWKGLPEDGIDAAVLWDNNLSYFFKGGDYYRFDDVASEVSREHHYPLSTAREWFSCWHRG